MFPTNRYTSSRISHPICLEGAIARRKSRKGPEVPPPFLPERLSGSWRDRPSNWSQEAFSVWLFPLYLFLSDVDELDLGVSRIRRLNNEDLTAMRATEERHTVFGNFGIPGRTEWHDFQGRELPWFLVVCLPKGEFDETQRLAQYLRRSAEVTLRIVGDRYVFTLDPVVFQPGVAGSLTGQYALAPADFPQVPASEQYHLVVEQIGMLKTIHQTALDTKDGRARIALRRFSRGYGRGDDDALVDFWIGLEALFSDGASEIAYKAAMRIAYYIGQDGPHRARLFRSLKDSYHIRSALVHGDHPSHTKSARQSARDALRLSLVKLLTEGTSPDVAALDSSIAAGT